MKNLYLIFLENSVPLMVLCVIFLIIFGYFEYSNYLLEIKYNIIYVIVFLIAIFRGIASIKKAQGEDAIDKEYRKSKFDNIQCVLYTTLSIIPIMIFFFSLCMTALYVFPFILDIVINVLMFLFNLIGKLL